MDDARMRLAQCEERRLRVLRGDGLIGILSVEEIEQMAATYRELGEGGSAAAWLGLAQYHLDNGGLDPSVEEAAECACRAIALGSVDAFRTLQGILPILRNEGLGDPPHAVDAYRAIEQSLAGDEDGRAHYLAGLLAFLGFGRSKDLGDCVRLHKAAAARGNTDAMFEMYVLLSTGTGVSKDEGAALSWCTMAAVKRHPRACYNVGAFYATGRGVQQDEAKALVWYGRASEAGNARAMVTLAYMVMSGSGCEADPARGEELFELAARQGFDVESFRADRGV